MPARSKQTERAARLLTLLPRLERGATLSVADLAREVGTSPADLADDLSTLSMCGVPPYSPDALIEVTVEDGKAHVFSEPPALQQPIRLTATEARALVAALEACGLDTVEGRFTGLLEATAREADVEAATRDLLIVGRAGDVYETFAGAVERGEAVEVEYFTASRGVSTRRVVHPYALADRDGVWYVGAYCTSAEAERVFRLDRVTDASPTGELFEPPPAEAFEPAPFKAGDGPVATVRFTPGEEVDEREWPGASITALEDGTVEALVPFASVEWLARRIVARLGAAWVVEPSHVKEVVVRMANSLGGEDGPV